MTGFNCHADELIMAFEDYGTGLQHFFDRQTGEVLYGSTKISMKKIERLEADPDRYLLIKPVPLSLGYEVMSDFVDTLPRVKVTRVGGCKDIRFAGSKTCCLIIRQFERNGFAFTTSLHENYPGMAGRLLVLR